MVAHLQDALAAAVADPDACTARCLTRLAEEDSRAEQPSWPAGQNFLKNKKVMLLKRIGMSIIRLGILKLKN